MTSEKLVNNKIHSLLTPNNCTSIMLDFQPQMESVLKSIDGQSLINNAEGLAKAARIFNIPTILTTVAEESFVGPFFLRLKKCLQIRKG